MKTLRFKTDRFRPYLPDECQVNPNALGFELADWVSRELAAIGIVNSYPNEEDTGWFLSHEVQGVECMIWCYGRLDAASGDDDWEIGVRTPGGWFVRPKPAPCEDKLLHVIAQSLEQAHIPYSTNAGS